MRNYCTILLFLCVTLYANAQEINALVSINSNQISGSNKQVYTTLQKALTEFINQKKWTGIPYKSHEKINCAFTIIITKQTNNAFNATLQVQSSRPVFNSIYETPIINIKDTDFNFKYNEFEPLIFNSTRFDSNLVSTIAFYVYVILGLDGNSFALNGGELYLKQAENIAIQAQQSNTTGWLNQIGEQNRYSLISNLLSPKTAYFHTLFYNYHRKGLDIMHNDIQLGKTEIQNSILDLEKIYNKTVGNPLIRLFLDAKSDEIVRVFSDKNTLPNTEKMIAVLEKVSPTNNDKWRKLD